MRSWTRSLLPALACIAVACTFAAPKVSPFYAISNADLPAKPGAVLRHEPIEGAPVGAEAWRVLYTSTGLDGKPIAVSGMVIVPSGPPPARGWDVVAWAHPTTGVARNCAPSLRKEPLKNIQGLASLLARGYVVTATDYPGLGTSGAHPYLVGESEGRAVLDLVRAARNLPAERIGPRFAVWGHSQGGQAALFAGELAASYAPELALVGVGAAAPATNLGVLLDDDMNSIAGRVLVSYAIWSWVRVYDANPDVVIKRSALKVVDTVAAGCVETYGEAYNVAVAASPLRKDFLTMHPDSVQPWRGLLERNRPGRIPTVVPFFIAQGSDDKIVRPAVTLAFAAHLCTQGARVRYLEMDGVSHLGAGKAVAPTMVAWLEDRFSGNPAPSDCEGELKGVTPSR